MEEKIERYINEILDNVVAEERMKDRIRKDLYSYINEAVEKQDIDSVLNKMGSPKDVAKEFMDSIYEDKDEVIDKLIQERLLMKGFVKGYYEYKSKTTIWGLPLVHVKLRRMGMKPTVAKGIIAVGDISIGFLSIGAIALGGLSIGGFSAGLLALGGLALGPLAMGGLAIGILAFGGLSIGLGAIGGCAIGNIAVGGFAKGHAAIGGTPVGDFILKSGTNSSLDTSIASKEQVRQLIKSAYPHISEWIVNIFTVIFK